MAMEVKDYCRNLDAELTSWKAKLYDVVRQMDRLPTSAKERIYEKVNALHIVIAELEERIDQLRTSCPTEWSPERRDIGHAMETLGERYNEASKALFDYDFGG